MRKLSIADINAADILSVEEKRNIVGGLQNPLSELQGSEGGAGGTIRQCLITECSVTYTDERGIMQTQYGKCQQQNIDNNTITCYCDAQFADHKITSNGGVSRCWA